MAPTSRNGLETRFANSRAPAAVTVRSMADSKLPPLSPDDDRVSSRLVRVEASMTSTPHSPVRFGGRITGRLPICVRSTYRNSDPTAANSARENPPKPPSSETPSCAFKPRSPARLSNDAAGTGVVAAPATPIQRLRSSSAKIASIVRSSLGDNRTSSPGKSGPVTSPVSISPVEMSSDANA